MGDSAVHWMGGLSIKRVSQNFQATRETVRGRLYVQGRRRSRMRARRSRLRRCGRPISMQIELRTESGDESAISGRRRNLAGNYASLCPFSLLNAWMCSGDAVNRSSVPGRSSGGRSSFATNSVPLSLVM